MPEADVTLTIWLDANHKPTTEDKAQFIETWVTMPDGTEQHVYYEKGTAAEEDNILPPTT